MLFVVSTPIGNLEDFTFRAVRVLKECDYILCEDTRHSLHLIKHYEIHTVLMSFHQFNESSKEESVIEDLKNGKTVGLISDAGTPTFADPGYRLIRRCIDEKIAFTSIPGASAFVTALLLSGLKSDRFQFCGFIPKKKNEQLQLFKEAASYLGTSIFYESPKRLEETLTILAEYYPLHHGAIAKELTKKFETIFRGTFDELLTQWKESAQKGEIVLLMKGRASENSLDIDAELKTILSMDFEDQKDALKDLSMKAGFSKRDLYKKFLLLKEDQKSNGH